MLKRLFIFALITASAFAAPVAVAYTESSQQDLTMPPCWTTSAVPYKDLAVPWDTTGHHTNHLNASASTGTGLTYAWTITAGPNSPTITSPASAVTAVTGIVAGQYTAHLVVTDSMMATNAVDLTIGAIGIDSVGNVIPTDSAVTDLFGPIKAWGYNPWCAEDERNVTAYKELYATLAAPSTYAPSYSDLNPSWVNNQPGTVSYYWNGVGNSSGLTTPVASLTSGINGTTLSIPVDHAEYFNLTEFPTEVTITASLGAFTNEPIRICSATGTSGAQTLTACYDGRGTLTSMYILPAQPWSMGALVGQSVVKGSGTNFLTNLCPAGVGSPVGPVTYSTGTVAISGTTITGTGTSWSAMNDVNVGYAIVISAAHSGTGFPLVRFITSVNSTTGITVSAAVPTTDSSTGLTYAIVRPGIRYFVAGMIRPAPNAGNTLTDWGSTTCESDTETFFNYYGVIGHSNATLDGTLQSGKSWSFEDLTGQYPVAISFYAPAMMFRSFYYRSGLTQPLTTANSIDNDYPQEPIFGGSGNYGFVLYQAPGIISASISYKLTGSPSVDNLRPWWDNAYSYAACNLEDTRDRSLGGALTTLGGLYDPDSSSPDGPGGVPWRAYFRTLMTSSIYPQDISCRNPTGGSGVFINSWANGLYFNPANNGSPDPATALTLTNGSASGTGTAINPIVCFGTDVLAAVTVVSGSASFTVTSGSMSSGVNAIMLDARYYQVTRTDATHGVMSALWPGSSGSVSGMSMTVDLTSTGGYSLNTVLGQTNSDLSLLQNYAIKCNSSSSVTLDRPFQGTTGTNFVYSQNVAGYVQQPFYMGIQDVKYQWAAPLDSALGISNATLRDQVGAWVSTYGPTSTNGMYYARVCGACESGGTPTGLLTWTIPGNLLGLNVSPDQSISVSRVNNAEAFNAIVANYIANPTMGNKTQGDALYSAVWGRSGYDASSVSSLTDSNSCMNNSAGAQCNLTNVYLSSQKYPGFFFGLGRAHIWAALRDCPVLGGVVVCGGGNGSSVSSSKSVVGSKAVRN